MDTGLVDDMRSNVRSEKIMVDGIVIRLRLCHCMTCCGMIAVASVPGNMSLPGRCAAEVSVLDAWYFSDVISTDL